MFDWNLAIEKNTAALTQIVAGLFVLVGMRSHTPSCSDLIQASTHKQDIMPMAIADRPSDGLAMDRRIKSDDDESVLVTHSTYLHLASVLRAAESALRRLIVLFMKVKGIKGYVGKTRADRSLPDFASFERGENRPPKFSLVDPRKPISSFLILSLSKDEEDYLFSASPSGSRPLTNCAALACKACSATEGDCPEHTPRINPAKLLQRLQSLDHALKNLPQQAKRMAREIEKRKAAPPGINSVPPIRIGYPPGYRESHIHDIDHILEECHGLVMDWDRAPP